MSGGHFAGGCPTRRQFLGGLAGAGAAAWASRGHLSAQAPAASPRRIDVHHHFASPGWIKALTDDAALNNVWKDWTPAKAIERMDQNGIQTAVASITTPGVWFGEGYGNGAASKQPQRTNEEARKLARETNEFGAKMVSDYKGRFGIFASLALPDIDGSLKEVEYALDTLKLQGIGLITSFGNRWLGDPMFTPVFEELNRRKAVVYTHPTAAPCCRDLIPGLGPTGIEYNTDTTRTIMSWIVSGSAKKFPDVKFIFSHGGGTLPYLAGRLLGEDAQNLRGTPKPDSRLHYIRKFYYDTTASFNPATMAALKRVVGVSQIVYGTDIPYGNTPGIWKGLEDSGELNAQELRVIGRDNALTLFPQYGRT